MDRHSIVLRAAKPTFDEGLAFARYADQAAEGFLRFMLGPRAGRIIATAFAQPDNETPFIGLEMDENEHKIPQLSDALAFLACRVTGKIEGGDHTIYAAEVLDGCLNDPTRAPMVRVRKNANTLQADERDRFLNAWKVLNNAGQGKFQDFRDMHVNASNAEEHGGPQFLPWHRTYLLDLERELQAIDPSVALHYWRFDQPAPNVFRSNFMGATTQVPEGAAEPEVHQVR